MKKMYGQEEKIASVILEKIRNQMKEKFPLLISAVNLLEPKAVDFPCDQLSTDGEFLLYSPSQVIKNYTSGCQEMLFFELFHVLMHGILGHLEIDGKYSDQKLLWTVMDYEVNQLIYMIGADEIPKYLNCYAAIAKHRSDAIQVPENQRGMGAYFYVKDKYILRNNVVKIGKKVASDDHQLWHPKSSEKWQSVRTVVCQGIGVAAEKDIGDQIVKALSGKNTVKQEYGSGSMAESLKVKADPENDNSYYGVIMNFLKLKEDDKVPPDAIDPMLYQYGLELYGDVPLIEPPETEERLNLNTICIALDSSGSCCGRTASQFLRDTFQILTDVRQITDKCEVYFFVCDDELQQEEHYESIDQIDQTYFKEMVLYGWGGTSFEPVFERIQELEEKEEKKIDCLIYLTDSYGDCPEEEPDYPVFFVLPNDQVTDDGHLCYMDDLPEWIRFVGLGKEE